MFTRKSDPVAAQLDMEISRQLSQLESFSVMDEEYSAIVAQLEKLYALRPEKETPLVSPDVLANVAGNLLITLIVVQYERAHVITTKAMQHLRSPR